MTFADYIKIAVAVLGFAGAILPIVAQLSFISKNSARTKIVQIVQEIVAQIEATLKANSSANIDQLLAAGVAELKSLADAEISKLGLPASMVDAELLLLLQRYGSLLPGIAGRLATDIAAGYGGSTGSVGGAAFLPRVARANAGFARSIGSV